MIYLTYLLIDSCTIIVPLAFSFHPALRFYRTWPAFFPAMLLVGLFFSSWDAVFTHFSLWGFDRQFLTGIFVLGLPLEELLFFLCVPYACVFTFFCLYRFLSNRMSRSLENPTTIVLIVLLLGIGICYRTRLYTSITFLSLAASLGVAKYVLKVPWLGQFYFTYAILLLPFFVVNGLLTGTGLRHAVVWYNAKAIIGVRIGTIPIEDIFYGMLLILLNLLLTRKYLLKHLPGQTPL
jgi:lycopene cyclase domain-containing protein